MPKCKSQKFTFIRSNKRFIVLRDYKGRFISVTRYSKQKKIILKSKQRLKLKQSVTRNKYLKSRLFKKKPISKISKKYLIDSDKFTNTTRQTLRNPLKNHRGVMVIEFKFIKYHGARVVKLQFERGYSNKSVFPRDYGKSYNLCLRRAASKVTFSWDKAIPVKTEFTYYTKNA